MAPGRAVLAVATALALSGAPRALPAVERLAPKEIHLKTSMDPRLPVYLYVPQAAAPAPGAAPVIFLSGDWGWRPLQQDTASHLVLQGRAVLGLDATEYFKRAADGDSLRADFGIFRALVNERSGRAKDAPVVLAGFGFGAEMIPYILNRAGTDGVLGALLIAPDKDGALVFRAAVQLKMPLPEGESFDVGEEVRRLPLAVPVVVMQGADDVAAKARALHALVRGPRRLVIVPGGDHQFKAVRGAYMEQVGQALRWIESGPVK